MVKPGTGACPLRVAIVGAGPAGFYAAEHLFKQDRIIVEIDMFDRLPTPFGLVRNGVAPDHQRIKAVTRTFDRTASNPRFRFFGQVGLGRDITRAQLRDHYHQIVYTTGAPSDRNLGIPGENLKGSYPATDFVAWYNGHPDFRDYEFDLSQERAAVVGLGNVAVDVIRILSRTPEELAQTDIADYALEQLRQSRVRAVYMLGRRGPAQAAFTNPEIKELGRLDDVYVTIPSEEATPDSLSQQALERENDRVALKRIEILEAIASRQRAGQSRTIHLRFLVSPVEILGSSGHVRAMRLVKNELYSTDMGTLRPKATDKFEELEVGLVFRSIGYKGLPLSDIPFNPKWGVILNEKGRVVEPESRKPIVGEYTAGWIKRGPNGVIGTNKPDALETVSCMLEDLKAGLTLKPSHQGSSDTETLIRRNRPDYFSYTDWQRIDEIEREKGLQSGRPRVKFTTVEEMSAALGR